MYLQDDQTGFLATCGVLLCLVVITFDEVKSETHPHPSSRYDKNKKLQKPSEYLNLVCKTLQAEATHHKLSPGFFGRLIWTESRFNQNAISPKNAQGIAQFIPDTAKRRNLGNPFDVKQALKASAHFLADLKSEFGNVGLAAAAYNAGEKRVRHWLAGERGLPLETRSYVYLITGNIAEHWKENKKHKEPIKLHPKLPFLKACRQKKISRFAGHKFPSQGLFNHPWRVQLAAGFSRHGALKVFSRLKRKYHRAIKNTRPIVLRKRKNRFGRRNRYAVVLGQPSRKKAERLCSRIRRFGGACMVTKN